MEPEDLITHQTVSQEKLQRAKEMRREMTPAERLLWGRLKANRLEGFHFRRQQIIGSYIADFYCHAVGLVIEVDGDIHLEQEAYDRQRDQEMRQMGLIVLRFTNADVFQRIEIVLNEIYRACLEIQKKNDLPLTPP